MKWALIAVMATPGWALAQEPPERLIAEYTRAARKLDAEDNGRRVADELGTLRAWLGEAQAYFNQRDERRLARALDRVRVQEVLVRALIARNQAEAKAREARSSADALERAAATLRRDAIELEQRRAALEVREAAPTSQAPAP